MIVAIVFIALALILGFCLLPPNAQKTVFSIVVMPFFWVAYLFTNVFRIIAFPFYYIQGIIKVRHKQNVKVEEKKNE